MVALTLDRVAPRRKPAARTYAPRLVDPEPGAGPLSFHLPPELEAPAPPEARGLARDAVRLMVSKANGDRIEHARFRDLPRFLRPGDLLVLNTSGTMNAALPATRADGTPLVLHLSTHLPADIWIVEVRQPEAERSGASGSTLPFPDGRAGETLRLAGGGAVTLLAPYSMDRTITPKAVAALRVPRRALERETRNAKRGAPPEGTPVRLWVALLRLPESLPRYLERHGAPIRYGYVKDRWPGRYYQTAYATETGSAEMPSAGRPFTARLIARLVARGVEVAPLLLHTGVASLEEHEPPYEEYYRVPVETARRVNAVRSLSGRRVIAVGTTAVRALETVTDDEGVTHPGEGWTRLVITLERGIRAVDGLITGLHEPRATHLAMLEALAGRRHLALAYAEALRERYLWHEFGDSHLILP